MAYEAAAAAALSVLWPGLAQYRLAHRYPTLATLRRFTQTTTHVTLM